MSVKVSAWERNAQLGTEQQDALAQLETLVAQRHKLASSGPAPKSADASASAAQAAASEPAVLAPQASGFRGDVSDAVLNTASEFYQWYAALEATQGRHADQQYDDYARHMQDNIATCSRLVEQTGSTLSQLDFLAAAHERIAGHTAALTSSCDTLLAEKTQLQAYADALAAKLRYFDEAGLASAAALSGGTVVDSEQFFKQLEWLDECIAHLVGHPYYKEGDAYLERYRGLQARALGAVRSKVANVLQHASTSVHWTLREYSSKDAGQSSTAPAPPKAHTQSAHVEVPEGAETAVYYVRFRAAAEPGVKGILEAVQAKAATWPEYRRLLDECKALYCSSRLALMAPVVESRITSAAKGTLPDFCRNGCAYLVQLCTQETQLFHVLFPPIPATSGAAGGPGAAASAARRSSDPVARGAARGGGDTLVELMEGMCEVMYDLLRPSLLGTKEVEALCELADIFINEVLAPTPGSDTSQIAPLRPIIERCLADVQERLIYRFQEVIRDNVTNFHPTPADLDYPAKLQRPEAVPGGRHVGADGNGDDKGQENGSGAEGQVDAGGAEDTLPTSTWYPPVASTILLLSQLYRCVDVATFSGLATEAVEACSAAILSAGATITKAAGTLDGQLFMVRHLLLLREQITPFNADLAITDRDLDFGHMRDYLKRMLADESGIFSWGSLSAMVALVREGPRIAETQVDGKKQLQYTLRVECERLIMHVTRQVVEPLLSFITKVTAFRAQGTKAPGPLRQQAFASSERVGKILEQVKGALSELLPAIFRKLQVYLPSPATQAILFKPIKTNIAEAHGQIAAILEKEYSEEDRAKLHLTPPSELRGLLDVLA